MATTKKTTTVTPKPVHDEGIATRLGMFRQKYIAKNKFAAAKKLGIAQSALFYMENKQAPVRYEFITRLVEEYGLNQDWLATGNGDMINKNPSKPNLLTDINQLNEAMARLEKFIKIMELTQNHLMKKLELAEKKIEKLEKELDKK